MSGSKEKILIKNMTKGKLPRLPFDSIKEKILGKNYELSIVFIGDKLSRKLNRSYRNKDVPTDILSFPLSNNDGEIFINLKKASENAPKFDRKFENFIAFLFIHGLVHLKGFEHSSRMEAEETKFRKKFGV